MKEKIKYIMTGIACATAIAAVIVTATLGTNSGITVNHKIALSTSAFSVGMCTCNLIYIIALQLDDKRENERQDGNQKDKRKEDKMVVKFDLKDLDKVQDTSEALTKAVNELNRAIIRVVDLTEAIRLETRGIGIEITGTNERGETNV